MQNKYCLPVLAQDGPSAVATIAANLATYGYFEVWLDYLKDPDEAFVQELGSKFAGRVILVFRRKQLEPILMPLKQRLGLLKAAAGTGLMVDLDAASQQSELNFVRSGRLGLRVIASYHNYELTPPDPQLHGIVTRLQAGDPYIAKVATMCQTPSDAVRLLQLSLRLGEHKHIILGMGPHGVATRVFGTLWGNEMVFTPDSTEAESAPGQLTRARLDAIFQNLSD